ncbi:cell division protein FtsL [Peptoniphilus asaccharolyticus DSM 20463]|uniref:Cell division protein FtsL n=1 Tax=Peptoniphilus asaccharolyticus DSM 20463 TaxID=573058 RepID=A0A1W1UJH8_PEPAS|nr:septum formation initiator family protein [Peptoniphilus asaccharolyticus]MBL7574806.1 septum formation initiator family protein [Peptoniphilus asaccharolyticus]SMB81199.1 cell division protein FtsL [Peptoniphilus asaccharolyticus DSM 20463]
MKRRRIPKIYIAIIIISVIYAGHNMSAAMSQAHDKSIQLAEYNREIKTLKSDINKLEKEKKSSGSLEFIEKVAREDLGMVKPREVVYIDKEKAEQK